MIETSRFTLDNGLRVIHNHDSATAMVALNVLYDVGARDEDPQLTGMAHLFEHLMFGGSANIPDFDSQLEAAGGMSNAWTSNDFTNFYDVVPAQNAETAFWLESDRMLALAFSDKALEVQRHVVIEEFKQQCLNRPYGDMSHYLRRMVYTAHPYRYPVIGKDPSHIERVTQDDVRQFFYSHYSPSNAVLAVSGNISADECRKLSEKWFADIPARKIQPRLYAPEPLQTSARETEATGDVPGTMITIAYPMAGYGTQDYFVADIISDILATGRSSRLYRNLLMGTDLFSDIDASIIGSEEPGFLMINARLRDNTDRTVTQATQAIGLQLQQLVSDGVSDRELERVLNKFESNLTFSNISYLAKAQALALSEMHREDINGILPAYRAMTAADVTRTATEIFNPSHCNTLVYRPR